MAPSCGKRRATDARVVMRRDPYNGDTARIAADAAEYRRRMWGARGS